MVHLHVRKLGRFRIEVRHLHFERRFEEPLDLQPQSERQGPPARCEDLRSMGERGFRQYVDLPQREFLHKVAARLISQPRHDAIDDIVRRYRSHPHLEHQKEDRQEGRCRKEPEPRRFE